MHSYEVTEQEVLQHLLLVIRPNNFNEVANFASLSKPHTSESFVLSTIHKKLRIKIGELTNASACVITTSIFARVMVHDTVMLTA